MKKNFIRELYIEIDKLFYSTFDNEPPGKGPTIGCKQTWPTGKKIMEMIMADFEQLMDPNISFASFKISCNPSSIYKEPAHSSYETDWSKT